MKKVLLLVSAVALACCAGFLFASDASDESKTLVGEYVWNRGAEGDLKAVFTPAGEGKWDVAFHFDFRDKPHVYSGTAEGDLIGGKISGEVKNESKKRTFTFTGSVDEGKFSGTHAEIHDGEPSRTGTLWLE